MEGGGLNRTAPSYMTVAGFQRVREAAVDGEEKKVGQGVLKLHALQGHRNGSATLPPGAAVRAPHLGVLVLDGYRKFLRGPEDVRAVPLGGEAMECQLGRHHACRGQPERPVTRQTERGRPLPAPLEGEARWVRAWCWAEDCVTTA